MKRFALAVLAVSLVGCGAPTDRCAAQTFGSPVCIPDGGIAAAGQKLKFEAVDRCNGGCLGATLDCVVRRDAGTLTVALEGQVCTPPQDMLCAAACAITRKSCELPALEEGDYTIVSPDQPAQTLKVRDGGSGSCSAVLF